MFDFSKLGEAQFQAWSDEQRRDEIKKLVAGYRNGLPADILCGMCESIAGSRKKARKHLMSLLSLEERRAAVAAQRDELQALVKAYLL
ncbi:hypothetical protein JCM30471_01650 [Desulfuromonas carbonis]|uniref:hypothetical protein n=1 Tax=Desulfuromonas sp. DDH964 TaxID=1823759 RepID=UPI00078DE995|nr:hypothetical protein [Desulfuromonas sp. DDH964]AMV71776.1 hypothetical protein DBW_1414 [Desulfuromonas sp. DDH964]